MALSLESVDNVLRRFYLPGLAAQLGATPEHVRYLMASGDWVDPEPGCIEVRNSAEPWDQLGVVRPIEGGWIAERWSGGMFRLIMDTFDHWDEAVVELQRRTGETEVL
jgi:hypothetical protein